jgi:hypothetical protein
MQEGNSLKMKMIIVNLKDFMQQKNHAFILLLKQQHELMQGELTIIIIAIEAKPNYVCKFKRSVNLPDL